MIDTRKIPTHEVTYAQLRDMILFGHLEPGAAVTIQGLVADLGAGWGYLSRAILARDGVKSLELIEAEAVALDCARANIVDPRATFVWADAISYRSPKLWDLVVMNPPFHAGREAEASLGMGFIKAAHRGLANSGQLLMVANRHLPYEPLLKSLFKQVETLGSDSAFRVTRAAYPVRSK